jgi:hypothetical protein
VPATTYGAQAALTPVPVVGGAPRRRSLGPAILAGAAVLAVAAAVVVFVVLRDREKRAPAPAPAPTPAPPVVVVTPPAHTGAEVTYHLAITPAGASVEVDGVPVELSRGFFTAPARPDRRLVTIRAPGHEDASVVLAGDVSEHREIALEPIAAAGGVGERPTRRGDRPRRPTGSDDPADRVQSDTGTAPGSSAPAGPARDPEPTKQLETGAKVYTDILDE